MVYAHSLSLPLPELLDCDGVWDLERLVFDGERVLLRLREPDLPLLFEPALPDRLRLVRLAGLPLPLRLRLVRAGLWLPLRLRLRLWLWLRLRLRLRLPINEHEHVHIEFYLFSEICVFLRSV